jgi:N-hydroxyarylamine O-acetyltransferase
MSAADLDAYFRRIDYHSDQRPTLDTLRAIQSCHTAAIAFENLTPLTRQPVRLDPASLLQKLVHDRRGGYCFEQNLLLRQVLQTLGFQVTGLAARVRWNVPDDVITARGHMLLRVDLDQQPYIVDVGFGGMTPTGPLRLTTEIEQRTPHEPFRVIAADGTYTLQALVDQAWKPVYRFDLQEQQLPDYEVTSWYLSNHPDSHFVTSLIAARPDAGRRYALRNNQFTVHHLDGASERRTLSSVAELRATLEDVFRLTLPDTPALDAAFERILAQSA